MYCNIFPVNAIQTLMVTISTIFLSKGCGMEGKPLSHYPLQSLISIHPREKMKILCLSSSMLHQPALVPHHRRPITNKSSSEEIWKPENRRNFKAHSAISIGFSSKPTSSKCQTCKGQGAVECPGCKGTGKNKKNGNIFERWKCFECQGFGLKGCPGCGTGGLTPEQRRER